MTEYPGRLVLLGNPVAHSLSPTFQNAALASANIPLKYEALDVQAKSLPHLVRELKAISAAGNVTSPHKLAVYGACQHLTELAARVGAVNTFWTKGGELHGDNTDVQGFDSAARALYGNDPNGAEILVLGAGGAAAAVLAAVEHWHGARVSVFSRRAERASRLAEKFPDVARVERNLKDAASRATLVVNATPIGQSDDEHPLDLSMVARQTAVMDLVYRREGTPWIRAARQRGHRAADGLAMLLEQGALSFQRWFGIEPDREAMRRSLM
ncbi:MAG: shikimate dehydrogenase [Gemmatimonadaceae bacterium]